MEPITLALLIAAGVKAAGVGMESRAERKKTPFDKRMAKQIEDLEKREEMDALGLTSEEMQAVRSEMQRATAASRRAGEARSNLALADAAGGSGQALSRAIAEEAGLQQQQQAIAETLATADLKEAAAEEDELNRLIFQQTQREMDRRAARAEAVQKTGDIGLETTSLIATGGAAGKKDSGDGFTDAELKATQDRFGVDEERAREYLEFQRDNPQFFEAI